MSDLKKAALELASKGVAVFPLDSNKKPRTSHGFHDATTDAEEIERFNWNSGGAIGAAIPEGHFVVDIDPRNGSDATLKALESAGNKFPITRMHRTRGGGFHRIYKLPDALQEGQKLRGKVGPGVDIKASGRGYIVYPPSEGYEVVFDRDPATAPQWLLDEILVTAAPSESSEASPPKFFSFQPGTAYGTSAMERELESLRNAPPGDRNNHLNKSSFSLAQLVAGGEVSESVALESLEVVATGLGLEEDEILQTLNSGWEAGLQEPRQAPKTEYEPVHDFRPAREEKKEPFTYLDPTDEIEPPSFYLHPIIPKRAYILVYGPTESAKSMAMVALAVEASHRGIKTSFHSMENPPNVEMDRLKRLNGNQGPDWSNFRVTCDYLDLNNNDQLYEFIEGNKAGGEYSWRDGKATDWIMIDTYSHAFQSRTEDGNAKAIEFAVRIRHVIREVGCSVILLDHTGYAHDEPRDASAKKQQVDMAILMKKEGIWAPGAPARFSMANVKASRFANQFFYRGEIADLPNKGLGLNWSLTAGDPQPTWEQ